MERLTDKKTIGSKTYHLKQFFVNRDRAEAAIPQLAAWYEVKIIEGYKPFSTSNEVGFGLYTHDL